MDFDHLDPAQRGGESERRAAGHAGPRAVALSLAVLLSLYVGLSLAYRDSIPLFQAPDEPAHLHYAAFAYQNGRFPTPSEAPRAGAQPPLVYAIAAPLLGNTTVDLPLALERLPRIDRASHSLRELDARLNGLRVLRGTSLAFGTLAVIFTFAAVWRVGRDARLALLATALLAFDPQFLFTSATFSNQTAAAAVGAAALWVVLRAIEEGGPERSHYVVGGSLIALGLLTRLSTLPGLAAAAVTVVVLDRRPQRDRRIDLALATGLALLLAGPYLFWSAEHRGGALGLEAFTTAAANAPLPEEYGGHLAYLTRVYPDETFASYWARFGWLDVHAPKAVYLAFFALSWTALLGLYAGRVREANALLRSRALTAYLLAAIGATLLTHLAINLVIAAPDGRFFFAVGPQIGLLMALGLNRLLGYENRTLPLTVAVVAGLLVLDLYCLRGMLVATYAGP